jgi:acid phosphatase
LRGAGSKSQIRSRLARKYRILLLVGDNLEDFVDGSKSTPAARKTLVKQYAHWFGRRWIVLPNPVYGHWEAAHYEFDHGVSRREKIERKRSALSP